MARAGALRAAGLLAEYHGDYYRAVACHEEAAAVWRELGDEGNLARTLDHLGNCAHDTGDLATAEVFHEQALELARAVDDPRGVASALGNLGIMAIHAGNLDAASERLEEALQLLRQLGHRHGVGVALANLGISPPAAATWTGQWRCKRRHWRCGRNSATTTRWHRRWSTSASPHG